MVGPFHDALQRVAGHGHPADAADRVTGDVCERRLKRQVVAFSATVYFQGNSASSDLLLANVEALSGDEGVDDCDIFTYVRDAVEDYSKPTEVTTYLSGDGTIVVTIGGIDFPFPEMEESELLKQCVMEYVLLKIITAVLNHI